MLKQYLREEERRAQHQAALIKLREKAIKEKASAEMDYLDQLKLKNKGDAERMTTIKKRQRAVVIKLQEEQVRHSFALLTYQKWSGLIACKLHPKDCPPQDSPSS